MASGKTAASDPVTFALDLIDSSAQPIDVEVVMNGLEDAGFSTEEDELINILVDEHQIWWVNDQFVRPVHVLPRRVLTHRLTEDELRGGFVRRTPDLHLLTLDEPKQFNSNRGTIVSHIDEIDDQFIGPSGWLSEFALGDLVAFRWLAPAELSVEPVVAGSDGALEVRALRAAMERLRDAEDVTDLLGLLVAVCDDEYAAFTDAPPVSELLARAGLCNDGDQIGDTGFDWLAFWGARRSAYAEQLAGDYDLDREASEGLALLATSTLWDDPAAKDIDWVGCAAALRDPAAVDAFLDGFWGRDADRCRRLATFANTVLTAAPDCAGAHLILGRVAEANGDALEHASAVSRALRIDPEFWPALADRGWVHADSGDARAAIRDLESVDDSDHWLELLDMFAEPGPMTASRNDRCPCGSGIKHKLCCGPHNGFAIGQRAAWLYDKALEFAARPAQRDTIALVVADLLSDLEDVNVLPGGPIFDALGTDPIVLEAALFGRGLVARFAEERRLVLPADEAALVEQWRDAPSRLLTIVAVEIDAVEFSDVITGDQFVVPLPGVEVGMSPGSIVCAYVLCDDHGPAVFAWSLVPSDDLDAVRAGLESGDALAYPRVELASRLRRGLQGDA